MVGYGRLRDLFDDAPTPHIAHPPHTHHRDYYLATDGSFAPDRGGLGAIVETSDGDRVLRLALEARSPNNNVAEYRALRFGLDALAARVEPGVSVGVLLDHDDLASNVNAAALGMLSPGWPDGPVRVPPAGAADWGDIRLAIRRFGDLRAAAIRSDDNPAHALANAPERYRHLEVEPHANRRDWEIPPPSRADRPRASD